MIIALLTASCASPASVKRFSRDQLERLQKFRVELDQAMAIARADRTARLKAGLAQAEAQIERLRNDRRGESAKPQPDAHRVRQLDISILRKEEETARLRAELLKVDELYANYISYLDTILIGGYSVLNKWHHRPGVPPMDSDDIAVFARTFTMVGKKNGSLQDYDELRKNLEEYAKEVNDADQSAP
jgi:chromosome segregation ATPase